MTEDHITILLGGVIGFTSAILTFFITNSFVNKRANIVFLLDLEKKINRDIMLLYRAKNSTEQFFYLAQEFCKGANISSIRYPKYTFCLEVENIPISFGKNKKVAFLKEVFELEESIKNLEERLLSIHKDLLEIREECKNNESEKSSRYQYIMEQEKNLIKHTDLVIDSACNTLSKIENKPKEVVKKEIEKKFNKSKKPEFKVPD